MEKKINGGLLVVFLGLVILVLAGIATPFVNAQTTGAGSGYTETIVHAFTETNGDGGAVDGGLVTDGSGNFYGTTNLGGSLGYGTVYRVTAGKTGTSYDVLFSFGSSIKSNPYGGLVLDSAGNLFGTGGGLIFELTPADQGTPIFGFESQLNGPDSQNPASDLAIDGAGNLYGASDYLNNDNGTVFMLSPEPAGGCPSNTNSGNGYCETVLYSFTGTNEDGNTPNGGLVLDAAGNVYGTTRIGGTSAACSGGCGTVFKLSPEPQAGCASGSNVGDGYCETVLYSFMGEASLDGTAPNGDLALDSAGNIYGTAGGGTGSGGNDGIVFKLSPQPAGGCPIGSHGGNGYCETALHNFEGPPSDGASPNPGLILDSAGNLYGTTESGGTTASGGTAYGTVFKVDPAGTESVLYGFMAGSTDGFGGTQGRLALDSAGDIYGTTYGGGEFGYGIVYKLVPLPATTTDLDLSPSSVTVGSSGPVVMSATASPVSGSGTPTGSITFFNGTTQIVNSTLTSGSTTYDYNPSSLAVGTYTITATYNGDSSFAGSTSPAQMLTVTPASNFTLSASPSSVSVAQGGSGTSIITVTDVGAFTGAVSLAPTGLPSGVTAAFTTGSASGTQVLTLTASTSAAVTSNAVTVTITGTSGSLSATTTVELSITAEPGLAPGSGGTTSISIAPGATTGNTGTISVVGTNGFSGTVNLTCSVTTTMTNVTDMPTCSLSPTSVTISGTTAQTSTLTITTSAASSAANERTILFWPSASGTTLALAWFFVRPRRRRRWHGLLGLLILTVSMSLSACGGGNSSSGGGGGGGGGGGAGAGNPGTTVGGYTVTVTGTSGSVSATVGSISLTVQTSTGAITTGVFADAPVAGLNYTCGGQPGVTDAGGTFSCATGSTVTLMVGGITACSAPAQQFMTPVSCAQVTNPSASASTTSVVAVSRFLQSISTTPASSGVLTITPAENQAAANQTLNFSNVTDAQLQAVVSAISPGAALVSAATATSELTRTINTIYAGNYAGTYSGGDNGTWNASLSSTGVVSGAYTSTSPNGGSNVPISGNFVSGTLYTGTAGESTWGGVLNTALSPPVFSGTWTNQSLPGVSGTFTGAKQSLSLTYFAFAQADGFDANGAWGVGVGADLNTAITGAEQNCEQQATSCGDEGYCALKPGQWGAWASDLQTPGNSAYACNFSSNSAARAQAQAYCGTGCAVLWSGAGQ